MAIFRQEVFPQLAEKQGGVINVKDYGAKGDGKTDDTAAFKRAIERNEIANQGKIIYVPNGTYVVRDTINWPRGNSSGDYYKRTTLLGETKDKTVIKLQDNTSSFSQAEPKALIDTQQNRANGFFNRIENLTLNTGLGNQNAIALKFNSNNGGGIFNVDIVSGDGAGSHGIDLTNTEIGPLLVKNVSVNGFDTGIKVGGGKTNSIHMENINLTEQNQLGIDQVMQVLTIRNLKSYNQIPVILTRGHSATLSLFGAELKGKDTDRLTAIETKYRDDGEGTKGEKKTIQVFLSDIEQEGYQQTAKVYDCEEGVLKTIKEDVNQWSCSSAMRIFSKQTETLQLPIEETPYIKTDLQNAIVVKGNLGSDIQTAIDTPGVKTVFLPNREYQVDEPIIIRGSVQKIIGMRAFFSKDSVSPTFIFEDGKEPIVSLERLHQPSIENSSDRSLVVKHSDLKYYQSSEGGIGDVFLEDVTASQIKIHEQDVWARSLNVEGLPANDEPKILNDGGSLWLLGLKTEKSGTILETKNRGLTEVLGGFIYINADIPDTNPPQAQYIDDESQVSIITRSYLPTATGYPILVEEINNGVVKTLVNRDRREGGVIFPYLGY